jgi:hypothetical protein
MLKFGDKVVGKVQIEKELTEKDIETIIVNGLEGGIGYWAQLDNTGISWVTKPKDEPISTWATKNILEGGCICLLDSEGDEQGIWVLTLDKLIQGYKLNYEKRSWDNDIENGDATTADCIIQYALFGTVVYG